MRLLAVIICGGLVAACGPPSATEQAKSAVRAHEGGQLQFANLGASPDGQWICGGYRERSSDGIVNVFRYGVEGGALELVGREAREAALQARSAYVALSAPHRRRLMAASASLERGEVSDEEAQATRQRLMQEHEAVAQAQAEFDSAFENLFSQMSVISSTCPHLPLPDPTGIQAPDHD